jgi:NAD(P)H-dependent FMN reductase
VKRVQAEVTSAQGLLFVTPEHNRSLPTALKNVLDRVSRPFGQNRWAGKPGAIAGASVGAAGTRSRKPTCVARLSRRGTLGQPEVYIQFTQGLIDDEGNISNDGTRKLLQAFVDRYAVWIAKFV